MITQIIPRYTSEYYCNFDYNYQMQKRLDKARVGYIPQVRTNRGTGLEILLGLNQVILSSELEGDGWRDSTLDVLTSSLKTCKSL